MAETSVAPLGTYKPAERRHWAFVARTNAAPPVFTNPVDKAWVKTPIDAFILAGLKKAGVAAIFGPGTPMDDIVSFIRENVKTGGAAA